MPKSVQGKAKHLIHEMYLAPTRKAALAAYDQFLCNYQTKFPKACECLEKDKAVLFTFYDFPAQYNAVYGRLSRRRHSCAVGRPRVRNHIRQRRSRRFLGEWI